MLKIAFLMLLSCNVLFADTKEEVASQSHKHSGLLPDEVDKNEIIRRGDWVEQVGVINALVDQEHSIEAAFATPPDDSDKWYISVICSKGCKYCEKLKYDFQYDSTLQAWVNVSEPAKSWAHYQVYSWEDETQKPRFEKIRIKGFPTLLIQPPRNGEFGSSATVVWQKTGYDGNTEKLSREMSNAIKRYVAAINEDRRNNPKEFYNESQATETVLNPDEAQKYSATPETEEVRAEGAVPFSDTIGVEPPFFVPNRDEEGRNHEIPPEVTGVLTHRELKELIPDADDEFIRTQVKLGATKEAALAAWAAHKEFGWFGLRKIMHWIVGAVITLVVLFFLFGFFIVAAIVLRFVYIKTQKQTQVVHEKEVIHDTAPVSSGVTLTKEEYAELVAKSKQSQAQSQPQQTSQIL